MKVYARDYTDAENSFVMSQKTINVTKEISQIQDLMLLAIRQNPNITTADLYDLTGITTRNVARNLKMLQEMGLLERVGGRKNGYWNVLSLQ